MIQKTVIALFAAGFVSFLSSCSGPTKVGNYGNRSLSGPSATMRAGASSGGGGYNGGGTTTSQILGRQRGLAR